MPGGCTVGSYGNSTFHFLRNRCTVPHHGCIPLRCTQKGMRGPTAPHPHQRLHRSVLFLTAGILICGFDLYFLNNSFIETEVTHLECTIRWLTAFPALCNRRHDQFWSISITPKRNSIAPRFLQPSPAPGKHQSTH